MIEVFLLSFATLFVIIDPIGTAPISVGLLSEFDRPARQSKIIRASFIAFFTLVIFGLIGEELLQFIGIGMPAFRISGGILLFLTALEILFQKRDERRSQQSTQASHDPTVFPLAMPLLAGPGAMTSMILLTSAYPHDYMAQIVIYFSLGITLLLAAIFAIFANRYAHVLGENGKQILQRILGVILAALAVQFVADGVVEILETVL